MQSSNKKNLPSLGDPKRISKLEKTAILYFTRSLLEEIKHKKLSSSKKSDSRLIKILKEKSRNTINKTGLTVFEINEKQQIGVNFGEKLSNAIENIFQKNYDSVIVVGNDCPSLKTEDILKTHKLLKDQKIVLGPDLRGGLYLIGVQKKAFEKDDFINLDWQSENLQNSIANFARKRDFKFAKLLERIDINFQADISKFFESRSIPLFAAKLKSILQFKLFQFQDFQFPKYRNDIKTSLCLRGPPAY